MLLQRESIEFAWQYLCFCLPISWLSSANIKALRIDRMEASLKEADIVILVAGSPALSDVEREWIGYLRRKGTPWLLVLGKADLVSEAEKVAEGLGKELKVSAVAVSALRKTGFDKLMESLLQLLPPDFGQETITGNLAKEGDRVILVMP